MITCPFDEQQHALATPRGQRMHVPADCKEPLMTYCKERIGYHKETAARGDLRGDRTEFSARGNLRACTRAERGPAGIAPLRLMNAMVSQARPESL